MKVAFHTLGCKVNQYESEALAEKFKACGYKIVNENDFADIYIVNTCTVTALADRKSRQYIRKMKKKNPQSIVAVTGCYAQIKPEEVASIEGVNVITGTNEKSQLITYIEDFIKQQEKISTMANSSPIQRHKTESIDFQQIQHIKAYDELIEYESTGVVTETEGRTRAYIKIQEGCNRFCSYCVIPYARGTVRSRKEEEIIQEANALLQKGYKEIVLTGINTALYGIDQDGTLQLDKLLQKLNALGGQFRIRLSSLEPTVVNAAYVKKLLQFDKLCHHLHLSLQSGSNKILKAMNRKYDRGEYLEIVNVLKEFDPEYGITTDIIAGFPGETEKDFNDSLDMIKQVRFCRVHPFKFSVRPGTEAEQMKEQIPTVTKKDRVDMLMKSGQTSSEKFYKQNIGKVREILVEEFLEDKKLYTGYTDNYIKVYLYHSRVSINQFYKIILLEPFEDGLMGELYD